MIPSFIKNYWFAIIAVSALLLYLARSARRRRLPPARDIDHVDRQASALGDDSRESVLARVAAAAFLIGLIVALRWTDRVALLQPTVVDYLLIAMIGGATALMILLRRNTLSAAAQSGVGYIMLFFGLLAAAAAVAILVHANALLDPAPAREYPTVVVSRHCEWGNSVIAVRGAPALPVATDTLRVHVLVSKCRAAQLGDTVVVPIRPGFFGRPWVQSSRLRTERH